MADRPTAEVNDAPATASADAGASATKAEGNVATVTEEKADTVTDEKPDAPAEEKTDSTSEEKPEGSAAATTEDNGSADTPAEKNDSPAATAEAEAAYAAAEKALEAAANALNVAKSGGSSAAAAGNGTSAAATATAPAAAPSPAKPKPTRLPREARAPRPPRTPFRKLPLTQQLWLAGGVIAVVALVIAGIFAFQATNRSATVLTQVPGTSMATDPGNPSLIDYTDPGTRFKLSFPKSWSTRDIGGSDVRLLAGPGGNDLMSVRVDTLDTGSQAPTQSSIEPYLNAIVQGQGVKIVTQQKISMDNLKGWYYVYTYTDASTKETGVHAQYFMIRGSQLYSIVFQAEPYTDFSKLANTYQQVANSIRFY